MRLIDADALLAKKGEAWDADGNLLYVVGTGNIMAAPTVNEWISVKDRLPDHSCKVLVSSSRYGLNYGIQVVEYSHKFKAFNCNDSCDIYKLNNVTHWMPLPEPPKEEQK